MIIFFFLQCNTTFFSHFKKNNITYPIKQMHRKPLVICSNGHSVCAACSSSMKLCPQCRWRRSCWSCLWVCCLLGNKDLVQILMFCLNKVRVPSPADHKHHPAEDLGKPRQLEGARAWRGRGRQVQPHAQVRSHVDLIFSWGLNWQNFFFVCQMFYLDSPTKSSVQTYCQLWASTSE